jgi:AcrR family transcriptional regulator
MTSPTPKNKGPVRRARPARQRRQGSARIEEILDAARHVLAQEGYAEFSLRHVARRVNIRLSTLQHYFPSRDDLLRAVVERTVAEYDATYVRQSAKWGTSARSKLVGMVRYLLDDLRQPDTAGFFVEFWARGLRDPMAGRLLQQAYRHHRDRIRIAMAPLNPSISGRTAELRALLAVALIEGLTIFIGGQRVRDPSLEGLEDEVTRWILKMARER